MSIEKRVRLPAVVKPEIAYELDLEVASRKRGNRRYGMQNLIEEILQEWYNKRKKEVK